MGLKKLEGLQKAWKFWVTTRRMMEVGGLLFHLRSVRIRTSGNIQKTRSPSDILGRGGDLSTTAEAARANLDHAAIRCQASWKLVYKPCVLTLHLGPQSDPPSPDLASHTAWLIECRGLQDVR